MVLFPDLTEVSRLRGAYDAAPLHDRRRVPRALSAPWWVLIHQVASEVTRPASDEVNPSQRTAAYAKG